MKNRFKGILFDFDGTLADTMESHFRAWKTTLAEYGVSISEADYFPLEGLGLREVVETIAEKRAFSETDINEIVWKKKEHYVRTHRTTFYPGVESLIEMLKQKKIPMGIVTAGHLDQLKGSVPGWFLSQFNTLVTGEQFIRGKPHPDPYLRGAKDLGFDPGECVAVENAPIGVESVKNAGIYCIAICTTVSPEQLSKADEILEKMDDLKTSPTIQGFLNTQP